MSSSARYRRPAKDNAPTDATNSAGVPDLAAAKEKAELKQAIKEQAEETSNGLSVLDVLRILGGLVLLSCGLSYLSTSGESMTWGYNPWWTRAREWKSLIVGHRISTSRKHMCRKFILTTYHSKAKSSSLTANSHYTMAPILRNPSTSPSTVQSTTSLSRPPPTAPAAPTTFSPAKMPPALFSPAASLKTRSRIYAA